MPEPFSERARSWARRNRTVVTASAAALVMAAGGPRRRSGRADAGQRASTRANTALTQANNEVQARFTLAMDAVKAYHSGVSEDLLLKEKGFDTLRTKLLRALPTSTVSSK